MNELYLAVFGGATLDLIALAVIALFAILGLVKGFAKSFVKVFGSIISLFVAILLCQKLATILGDKTDVLSSLTERISEILTNSFGDTIMNTKLCDVTENAMGEANLGGLIIGLVIRFKNDGSIPLESTLNQVVAPVFAFYCISALCAVAIYIVCRILFFLIGAIIKKLHVVKAVKHTDRILGLIFGIIRALILISLALLILNLIPLGIFQTINQKIESTLVLRLISKINIFSLILKALSAVKLPEIINSLL